jgi:23S rRNA (cytidine1920-2'-O)/16S rRNA (cytidine1409-2'-O)-methyltransferase
MAKKIPLLLKLTQEYPEYTKDQLTAFIICKNVKVNGELLALPKEKIDSESAVSFTFDKYVSRGGYKLEAALKAFDIDVRDRVMLDAGSSTGGFTDCLLQHGAKMVHSVDVGYNQLDWKMRTDERVVVHEKQNIMNLKELDPPASGAVCDLSFRSISGAASHVLDLSGNNFLLCLIKPQFEMPRWQQDFSGVVKSKKLLKDIMMHVYEILNEDNIRVQNLILSPIKGRKGNTEFLSYLTPSKGLNEEEYSTLCDSLINTIE